MFIDKAKIFITSGNGGRGAISFRREKFLPMGGPDGGNGGNGGNVYVQGSSHMTSLEFFFHQQHFSAENGTNGGSGNCTGKTAKDLIIKVPLGTVITMVEKNINFEIIDEKKIIILSGGKGGTGNAQLKNSKDRAPHKSLPPEEGESDILLMELKIIADVGLVGMPNAGKSSFINAFTNANSRVEYFPFSTTEPVLGTYEKIKFIDIPGIMEGAHRGKGMGIRFLQHIERCKHLLLIIDIDDNPIKTLSIIYNELKHYGLNIPHTIILNKIDLVKKIELAHIIEKIKEHYGFIKIFTCSAKFNFKVYSIVKHIVKEIKSSSI